MFSKRTNWQLEPNRLARAIEARRASGKPVIDLTASNPTRCGFVYPQDEILKAIAGPLSLEYSPDSKGMRCAREAVASYYTGRSGFFQRPGEAPGIDPERIVLTASTSEAYGYILRLLCEPGDEVLVSAPSYPLFQFLADLNDVHLSRYALVYDHGWRIDLHSLESAITRRTRAVLLVHPNNPTGSFASPDEARRLAELCGANQLAIIADEVFLDFGERPEPSFAFEQDALTFTLSGLSKICALPQMKLAWMVVSGPPALAAAALSRLEVIADTFLSPGTPVQLGLDKLLQLREQMQSQVHARVAANLAALDQTLSGNDRVSRLARQGGWYAILRVPATQPDHELAIGLLEQHLVLVHPGSFYDFEQEGIIVVSLITPQPEFAEGIQRLVRFFAG